MFSPDGNLISSPPQDDEDDDNKSTRSVGIREILDCCVVFENLTVYDCSVIKDQPRHGFTVKHATPIIQIDGAVYQAAPEGRPGMAAVWNLRAVI